MLTSVFILVKEHISCQIPPIIADESIQSALVRGICGNCIFYSAGPFILQDTRTVLESFGKYFYEFLIIEE